MAGRNVGSMLQKHGYTEIKKIGEGSFGQALLVQAKDGSQVVAKMVDVSKASTKERDDATKEGRVLASLKHPFIVRYRENFTDGGWFCILMDYCRGGDLAKQIEIYKKNRQMIEEPQVLRWFTQAMMALKYIHERHILHRDLKPGNFFLSKSGNLKMGDFGIAKVLSSTMACAKTQIGTPYYLSPEVCQEKPYTWGSDIWAMGCVLFEVCQLKVPFDAPSISGLVQKIVRGPVPVPYNHSPVIRELVAIMLNRNAVSRPLADDILKRPQIQAIVRCMLDEVQGQERADAAANRPDLQPAPAAPAAPPPPMPLSARDRMQDKRDGDEFFRQGELVEYYSGTHGKWIAATILKLDSSSGSIIVDLKPSTWITRDKQVGKIRRRKAPPKGGRSPSPAARIASPSPAARAAQNVFSARGPSPRRNARVGGA